MKTIILKRDALVNEMKFVTSRSSGAGGQNVNKVETKVELRFSIINSKYLSDTDKYTLLRKLDTKVNKEGVLILTSQKERSQLKNKELVIEKFFTLIEKALVPVKKRKPTKPTMNSKVKRLNKKHRESELKTNRRKLFNLDE